MGHVVQFPISLRKSESKIVNIDYYRQNNDPIDLAEQRRELQKIKGELVFYRQ